MGAQSEDPLVGRLLEAGRLLVTELDLETVLDRLLETARELTGARYAALGVLNEERAALSQFLTDGIDEQTRARIGSPPRGRGVLGVMIEDPRPLRLADVGRHELSYGYPPGHPVMRTFLGVPIMIRGRAWGNLYLTEKDQGEFSAEDERVAMVLADWAAVAIDNARLYESSELRRRELEQAVRGLEATRDVAIAIGGEIALEHVLELIGKRGRALVGARSLVIMLRDGGELVVHASAGDVEERLGTRVEMASSPFGEVLDGRRPERIADVDSRLALAAQALGVSGARTALLVPMQYRGEAVGVMAVFDRDKEGSAFSEDHEQTLLTFAASAATAVVLAQSVLADRLRSSLAAAEAERRRWARELHDETLQGLGGLRLLLSAALRRDDVQLAHEAMRDAVERIEREIENLRSIITDLRPAALDELGLRAAIEALLDRQRGQNGLEIEHALTIASLTSRNDRLDDDLETAVYRLVQEALTNVAKHSGASMVLVAVSETDDELIAEVRDDGSGFDSEAVATGFGLAGMRERVSLAGGTLRIDSGRAGTLVVARLPIRRGRAGAGPSDADEPAP